MCVLVFILEQFLKVVELCKESCIYTCTNARKWLLHSLILLAACLLQEVYKWWELVCVIVLHVRAMYSYTFHKYLSTPLTMESSCHVCICAAPRVIWSPEKQGTPLPQEAGGGRTSGGGSVGPPAQLWQSEAATPHHRPSRAGEKQDFVPVHWGLIQALAWPRIIRPCTDVGSG